MRESESESPNERPPGTSGEKSTEEAGLLDRSIKRAKKVMGRRAQ
ncbi:hypothetical protein CRG98_048664, partial [Punica granatum]